MKRLATHTTPALERASTRYSTGRLAMKTLARRIGHPRTARDTSPASHASIAGSSMSSRSKVRCGTASCTRTRQKTTCQYYVYHHHIRTETTAISPEEGLHLHSGGRMQPCMKPKKTLPKRRATTRNRIDSSRYTNQPTKSQ